jgi:ParB/RepB/Spo0J family partition protein
MRLGSVFAVPVGQLHRNPANPRRDLGDLTELAASIKKYGVLQPVVAERAHRGRLTLRFGQRRVAAARKAGLTVVPTLVVPEGLPDDQLVTALVENLHRAAMAPIEEARACKTLLDFGLSRADIANALAHSPQWVADRLALLELPRELQREIDDRRLPLGQAADLARNVRRNTAGAVVVDARSARHFTSSHPLSSGAKRRCDRAGHPKPGRVGPACGVCREQEIREDQDRTQRGVA